MEVRMKRFVSWFVCVLCVTVLSGCLPLSVIGTTSEEVMAQRPQEPVAPVAAVPAVTPIAEVPAIEIAPVAEVPVKVWDFNVGDVGPAGGYIFYDKGLYQDGWRYLEMAPAEADADWMLWGGGGVSIEGTSYDTGTGKENTDLIVSLLGRNGDMYPARYCDELVYGGYDDWFLPSIDALVLAYENLTIPGIGDFPAMYKTWIKNYWSSTVDGAGGNYAAFAFYLESTNGVPSGAGRDFRGVYVRPVRRL